MFKRFFFLLTASFGISQLSAAQEQNLPIGSLTNKTGYYNITELSFSPGYIHKNQVLTYGIQTVNGYSFNEHVKAGIGIGLDQYAFKNSNGDYENARVFLPLFSDIRFYIGKGEIKPFIAQSVGYAFPLNHLENSDYNFTYKSIGGLIVNPAFGVSTYISPKVNLNFSFGYRHQQYSTRVTRSYLKNT